MSLPAPCHITLGLVITRPFSPTYLQPDNDLDLLQLEGVEDDEFVDPVDELGAEMAPDLESIGGRMMEGCASERAHNNNNRKYKSASAQI